MSNVPDTPSGKAKLPLLQTSKLLV